MNAPARPAPDDPGVILAGIGEAMWSLKTLAEIGERHAALGDLVGLAYCLRRITATTRLAVSAAGDLRELVDRQHAEPERETRTFTVSEPSR